MNQAHYSDTVIKHIVKISPTIVDGESKILLKNPLFLHKISWNYTYRDVGINGAIQRPLEPISFALLDKHLNKVYSSRGVFSFHQVFDQYLALDGELTVVISNPNTKNLHRLEVEISLEGIQLLTPTCSLSEASEEASHDLDIVVSYADATEVSKKTWLQEKTIPSYEPMPTESKVLNEWDAYIKRQQLARHSRYQEPAEMKAPISKIALAAFLFLGLLISPVALELALFVILSLMW